jgi:hypothetical protein
MSRTSRSVVKREARLLRQAVAVAAALSLAWVGLSACWCPEEPPAVADHCCCGAGEAEPHSPALEASSCAGPCVTAPLPARGGGGRAV